MFQGLRTNSILYILEKNGVPTLKVGQVVAVSNPMPKFGNFNPTLMQETFVDVSVKVGEETIDLKQLPSGATCASLNGAFVTESRDTMSAEVEGILKNSEQIINSVDFHEKVKDACHGMLGTLNPQLVKEQERDEKMSAFEKRIEGMESSLNNIVGILKSLKQH